MSLRNIKCPQIQMSIFQLESTLLTLMSDNFTMKDGERCKKVRTEEEDDRLFSRVRTAQQMTFNKLEEL